MPQSTTEIANFALGHVGVSKLIGNLDAERSLEAQTCRLYYSTCLDEMMNGKSWTFCKKFATLALVSGPNPKATVEWTYAYRYPQDCLQFLRIISERLSNDTRQSRVPYTIAADAAGLLIYTNWPPPGTTDAQVEYIFRNTNVGVYPPDFASALSFLLASKIAPVLTAGDPFKLGDAAYKMYEKKLADASDTYLNEEQRPEEPQSEFVRSRDGDAFGSRGEPWSADASGFEIK